MILRILLLLLPFSLAANDIVNQFDGQKTVDRKIISGNDLKGKVILIDYWGMNCSPCVAALPKLQKLHEKFSKSKKFYLIASHVASGDKLKIEAFMKTKKYTFPTLRYFHLKDENGLIKCRSLPMLILINKEGKIVESGSHIQDLEKKIQGLIKAK